MQAHLTDATNAAATAAAASLDQRDVTTLREWLALADELDVRPDLLVAQEHVYDVAVRARAGRLAPGQPEVVAALAELVGLAPSTWAIALD